MLMKSILSKAIKRIHPEEQELKEADAVIKKINELLKENRIDAVCTAGGSYAKGTVLKDDFDIDLFVRFEYDTYKSKNLSELLRKAIKSMSPELVHGSRDYFQMQKKGIVFEIIPVLMISDYKKALNVTDMSPLHVNYVRKKTDDRMRDDIRLAKQFCKSIKVYGAESYIKGFSGHILDLMIIYYGSFEQLLKQASVWGEKVIIDIEGHLKDPVNELNKAKISSPIILVDPVQPVRNAAAALSKEKFELFKEKAREFLKSPSDDFFRIEKLDEKKIAYDRKKEELFVVKAIPFDGKKDVVGAKVMKAFEHIVKSIKKHGFTLTGQGWEFNNDKSIMYFTVKKEELPEKEIIMGPPIKVKRNAGMFKARHKKVFEDKGRLFAEEKREFRKAGQLIGYLLEDKYIKERIKKII